jgi:hypothetical protein
MPNLTSSTRPPPATRGSASILHQGQKKLQLPSFAAASTRAALPSPPAILISNILVSTTSSSLQCLGIIRAINGPILIQLQKGDEVGPTSSTKRSSIDEGDQGGSIAGSISSSRGSYELKKPRKGKRRKKMFRDIEKWSRVSAALYVLPDMACHVWETFKAACCHAKAAAAVEAEPEPAAPTRVRQACAAEASASRACCCRLRRWRRWIMHASLRMTSLAASQRATTPSSPPSKMP